MTLTLDSNEEKKRFSALKKEEELLWRSTVSLKDESFSERFAGSIDFGSEKLKHYKSKIEGEETERLARLIIRERFLSQEIILQALQLIEKK